MDAKRWSLLWAFVGGCLSSAALISWRAESDETARSPAPRDLASHLESSLPPRAKLTESAAAPVEAVTPDVPAAPVDSEVAGKASDEAGNSLADVLARLEADYRERLKPAPRAEPAVAEPVPVQSAAVAEPPVVSVAAAQPPTPAPAPVVAAAEPPSALTAAEPAPERVVYVRDERASAVDDSQERLAAQMQEVVALQQVALLQQIALMQYLQLVAPAAAAPVAVSVPAQRRVPRGRPGIFATSSFGSATPAWGFSLQPTVLVR